MAKRALIVAAAIALTVAGCARSPSTRQLVQDAVMAMGGADRLRGIQTMQMRGGQGTRLRHGQTARIGDTEPAAQLTNVIETVDLANGRAALDYEFALQGFTQHRQEILTKKGQALVGLENVEGRPLAVMSGTGLFSWGTQNSPGMLLRRNVVSVLLAAADSATDEAAEDRDLNGTMLKYGRATLASGEAVGLYFDPTSKLLTAYEVTDTEAMLGDVPAQYLLDDYRDVSGVRLPHRIAITKGGQPYADVQFSSLSINDADALSVFAIPDAAQADVDTAIAAGDYSPVTLVKVADGVTFAQAYSHHSMVVEFPTFLVVVEAPYTEAQSKTLARLFEAEFPGKPIRHVVATHHHFDHIGGIRGIAAVGATVLVDKRQAPALQGLLDAPHTNPPDELETRRRAGEKVGTLETFDGMRTITEGAQTLQLHTILDNPHVSPKVVAYVPSSRILFQSDLWIPGVGVPGSPDSAHLLKSIQSLGLRVDRHVGGHGAVGPHGELVKAIGAMK
jgi:hypothetical protein